MRTCTCESGAPARAGEYAGAPGRTSLSRAPLKLLATAAGLVLPWLCASGADSDIKPLFEPRVEHEFSQPRETFEEILQLIQEHYYTDQIDEKSLWWGGVQGVLRQISPAENKGLAQIWLPEQYEQIHQSLQGVQESIGIKSTFNPADGSLTVTEVFTGGPSESLLMPYDRIVRIDGQPLQGLSVKEIESLLKGDVGTRVSLKVVRDVAVFDMLVARDAFKVVNVETQLFGENIGYVAVLSFAEGVNADLRAALESFAEKGVNALIVDLRNNSGGVFAEALKCAELFRNEGERLMRMVSHGNKVNDYVAGKVEPFQFHLAVLVNKKSASASEIVAAALQDGLNAPIVGENTYGKATMEKIFTLKNDYRVKFTTAALYSPKGRSWQKTGLMPDYPVAQAADIVGKTRKLEPATRLTRDYQLLVAYRILSGRLQ